jgi:hypothetical protein
VSLSDVTGKELKWILSSQQLSALLSDGASVGGVRREGSKRFLQVDWVPC